MRESPRVLAFAGSARKDSFNKRLVKIAAAGAEAAGVACSVIDLRDYPLPIYDADLEAEIGLPEHAVTLKNAFAEHQGLLIASPEYNGSVSPLLKNTIDWVSRPLPERPALAPFQGKVAAILAASPGSLGGIRGLAALRSLLSDLGCTVIADQVAIRDAYQAFTPEGRLADADQQSRAEAVGTRLAQWVLDRRGASP